MVLMAERGSRVAGGVSSGPEDSEGGVGVSRLAARPRRVVALRTTSGPARAVAPPWGAGSSSSADWAADPGVRETFPGDGTGGWHTAACASSASALAESVFPFGSELPYEPDPEAAAFLNAPRRPLTFYVAPFGTPPFGNAPSGHAPAGRRSVFGGPVEGEPAGAFRGPAAQPAWGPAYPAGA
jgi:hypothetical protein